MSASRKLQRKQKREAPEQRMIECNSHGKVPWLLDVMCEGCGKLYNLDDPSCPKYPELCSCGKALTARFIGDNDFSARLVCPGCAKSLRLGTQ